MTRRPIRTRDHAEKVADRIRRDSEALFAVVGHRDIIRQDEILLLHELDTFAKRAWEKLLRRNTA